MHSLPWAAADSSTRSFPAADLVRSYAARPSAGCPAQHEQEITLGPARFKRSDNALEEVEIELRCVPEASAPSQAQVGPRPWGLSQPVLKGRKLAAGAAHKERMVAAIPAPGGEAWRRNTPSELEAASTLIQEGHIGLVRGV